MYKRQVQLTEGNDGGVSAQTLDQAVHDGVVGHAQLQGLEISDAGNGVDSEEVTEALFAVEDTTNGQAQLLGLVQELKMCIRDSRLSCHPEENELISLSVDEHRAKRVGDCLLYTSRCV